MATATCHLRLGLFATTSRHSRCQETSTTMPQTELAGKTDNWGISFWQGFSQNQNEILSPCQGQGRQNEAKSLPTFRASNIITPTPIRSCNRSWIFHHGIPKTLHFQNTGEWPLPLRQTVTRTQSDTVELQNFTKAPSAFGFSCAPATHPHRLRTLHQMFPPENPTSWHRKHFAQAYTSFTFATSVNSHKFLKMEDVQCSTPSQRSQTFESILKGELRSAEFLTLRVIKIVQSSLAIFRRVPVGHIASVSVFGHTAKC